MADLWHEPNTWGDTAPDDVLVWRSDCPCGWTSGSFPHEYDADMAGLEHDPGEPWVDAIGAQAAGLYLASDLPRAPGLSSAKMFEVRVTHGVTFAPDHHWFLRQVLPRGEDWPDWRADRAALGGWIRRPQDDLLSLVASKKWWWDAWGARPARHIDAVASASLHLSQAPRLAPVRHQHFALATPRESGNPVLSWFPGDSIRLHRDLAATIRDATQRRSSHHPPTPRNRIPFWSDLVDSWDPTRPGVEM